ncbi:pathogenesis-related homeodomain protein isoform X2 [Magnolia sinica]|uniref:pathogenesis-related homeodomain protein isoform X2 n=1 Tax=Magnolia sinica TaxID=86752 RepID=UPI002657F900|nr:pathogenesis-related homeodomain protein isoform X2 [Magnolia sinica]
MTNARKRILNQASGKSSFSKKEIGSKRNLTIQKKSSCKMSYSKRCKLKPRSVKTIGSIRSKKKASEFSGGGNRNNSLNGKRVRRTMQKLSNVKANRKQSSLQLVAGKPSPLRRKRNGENAAGDGVQRIEKRRKKKRKERVEPDEASRLQRRTRYLLIKMKLEQNLIDAYSGEGWKGQSREKIKPEKELQRAVKQILRCKLGIRDAIRQLELLSSEGCIEDAVINPDGSVFHEHIFCAKCKSRDVFPDNDIILCDGTCNCAFHQKCLEPPLATENIPPGDQGWLCKFCECKMEILEAVNAHLGTRFTANSNWQDIFKEEATAPDGENTSVDPAEEWPSDDSEDEDYNPEMNEKVCSRLGTEEEDLSDDACSSSSLFWSSDEASSPKNSFSGGFQAKNQRRNLDDSIISIDSDDTDDREIMSCRRQRKDVDYKKLYDEMFGKAENEQLSEDEDWGPRRRKQKGKESDAGTVMAACNDEARCLGNELTVEVKKKQPAVSQDRKPLFRIPPNAVEKLRQVFAENELPSRAIRESLSKQLGIAFEKVNKWFKNARYTALKIRKAENTKQLCSDSKAKGSNMETVKNHNADLAASKANSYLVHSSVAGIHVPKSLRRIRLRKNPKSISTPLKKQRSRAAGTLSPNTITKLRAALIENQFPLISSQQGLSKQLSIPYRQVSNKIYSKKQTSISKRRSALEKKSISFKQQITCCANEMTGNEQMLVEMERLFRLEDRIEKLKKVVKTCIDKSHASSNETHLDERPVIYVPVAEVREKVRSRTVNGS